MDLNAITAQLGALAPAKPEARSNAAAEAASGFVATMREAELQAMGGMGGGADPHALVTALAEGKLAIDTVVTIRDRVVEAYQEILRMPV